MADAATTANALEDERFVAWQAQRQTRERFLKGFAALVTGYTAWQARALAENAELDALIAGYRAKQTKKTA